MKMFGILKIKYQFTLLFSLFLVIYLGVECHPKDLFRHKLDLKMHLEF